MRRRPDVHETNQTTTHINSPIGAYTRMARIRSYAVAAIRVSYRLRDRVGVSEESFCIIVDVYRKKYLFEIALGLVLDFSNVRHGQAVPFVDPAKYFSVEFRKQSWILLKEDSLFQDKLLSCCESIMFV